MPLERGGRDTIETCLCFARMQVAGAFQLAQRREHLGVEVGGDVEVVPPEPVPDGRRLSRAE